MPTSTSPISGPTSLRETAAFAAEDGPQPFVINRDRSLDPQLVWKGKDEQDAKPLEVPAVPIHVQEKIHPQAIIEDLKRHVRPTPGEQPDLFADFNGLDDFQKKLEFYQHDQHWTNRLILGDSLLVMASLAEKERLRGQVQCIYFDPPYGIKFGSNWQVSTRKRDVKDAKAEDLTRQPEQIKAFRDTWELGIHSYLTYLRDRLAAARELLTESGSIFVQIGDENVHLVRALMDEVFGSENFVAAITFRTSVPLKSTGLAGICDFILWYARSQDQRKFRDLFTHRDVGEGTVYTLVEEADGTRRRMTDEERSNPRRVPKNCKVFCTENLVSSGYTPTCIYPVGQDGKTYYPTSGKSWKTNKEGMAALQRLGRVDASGQTLRYVLFYDDYPVMKLTNLWTDMKGETEKAYVVQTNTKAIERCLLMTTDPGDLVLDPTCGSGTTAYVAEQWGRRWITIDTSRVALALARTRLMAARFPYYLLADSPEGRKKQTELLARSASEDESNPRLRVGLTGGEGEGENPRLRVGLTGKDESDPRWRVGLTGTGPDLHKGFVYRTVPHVTLKSIANNPDIKEGMTREQIDRAIAKHAESETLYDQPYEDKNIVRVTGPFTVESLSPHRSLPEPSPPVSPTRQRGEESEPSLARRANGNGNFLVTILDNLRKAGVKGTDKRQRIQFTRLDPFPGEHIQAEGETDTGAAVRVCVGPEFGTLGDADIKKAALQAILGSRCDLLLVCAFSFEPSVHEQTAELTKEIKLGKLAVLPVRMNPDLAMGDELLKKTGAGNLFTVFGEPDVTVSPKRERGKPEQWTVTIRGVDVFDPTTGAVRTGETDDIACWFIDTDYDGQSFFVRHAYFLYGGKNTSEGPYDKLKKALRAEIDEGEWSKLYRATSQPFDPPKSGKIAVKVINHFGDEVLKVYSTSG